MNVLASERMNMSVKTGVLKTHHLIKTLLMFVAVLDSVRLRLLLWV